MFNLKKAASHDLINEELRIFGIVPHTDGSYCCTVGDETIEHISLQESKKNIKDGIKELKSHLWEDWQDLGNLSLLITNNESNNTGSLDNLVFLGSIKRIYSLSCSFSELEDISENIFKVFQIDVKKVHNNLIAKFNSKCLKIKLLHRLILHEIYRCKLVSQKIKSETKLAGVSGPWANLDLPMSERMWSWAEDEEYFDNRSRAKKEQTRYNPEYNKNGFYYVWQDLATSPYSFEDINKDSPYKSRHILQIP